MATTMRWIAAAVVAGMGMAAGSATAMTMTEAYEAALANDPAFQGARSERDANRLNIPIGRAALLPQVTASASYIKNQADIVNTGPLGENRIDQDYPSRQAAIQLRQPLYHPEALSRYRQGIAQARYGDTVFTAAANDLMLRVVTAYFDVQIAKEKLAIATVQRDAFSELVKLNQQLLARGQGTRTDVLETQARYELALAQVIESQDLVTTAQATLAAIVGQQSGALTDAPLSTLRDDAGTLPMLANSLEEWQAIALSTNPEIAALREAVAVSEEAIRGFRARHYPRVDAIASLSKSSSETTSALGQEATVRSVGVQMQIPLYAGGAVDATVTQAALRRDRAKADLETKSREVLVELRKQYQLVQSGVTRIAALSRAVEAARLAVEATRRSIAGGERVNVDLLQAQQQLQVAQTELTEARYTHLLSQLRLRNAAIRLSDADLQLVAAQLVGR